MNKKTIAFSLVVLFAVAGLRAANTELTALLTGYKAQARKQDSSFRDFSAERGKEIYFKQLKNDEGKLISCSTCHGENLANNGKNTTGKVIEPLSPRKNPKRLTDTANIEKWLKRNFKQVYGREGTVQEKGDVLYFIMNN